MAKINEIIYDVREAIREFSDDSDVDNRYILYLYNIKRAKYLRQELNNYNRRIDISIQQSICLKMELVNGDDCGDDCPKLLRSSLPVPTPLELHTKPAIISVKPTTKISVPFNFISKEKIAYIDGAQFSNGIYSFLDDDGYLYAYSLSDSYKLLKCVTLIGVFSDPISLESYPNCCDCTPSENPCFNEETTEYPLQPHFIDLIRLEIVRELSGIKQFPQDRENNATDI